MRTRTFFFEKRTPYIFAQRPEIISKKLGVSKKKKRLTNTFICISEKKNENLCLCALFGNTFPKGFTGSNIKYKLFFKKNIYDG